jgi:hypothetical protein
MARLNTTSIAFDTKEERDEFRRLLRIRVCKNKHERT